MTFFFKLIILSTIGCIQLGAEEFTIVEEDILIPISENILSQHSSSEGPSIIPRIQNSNLIKIHDPGDTLWRDYTAVGSGRWNTQIIPFHIFSDPLYPHLADENFKQRIYQAIKIIENSSLIRFIEIPPEKFCWREDPSIDNCESYDPQDDIYFKAVFNQVHEVKERKNFILIQGSPDKCAANIGKSRSTITMSTSMILAKSCTTLGIVHEFLHNLGLLHTQSRFDRDKYIKMKWDEIEIKSHYARANLRPSYFNQLSFSSYQNFSHYFYQMNESSLKDIVFRQQDFLDFTLPFTLDPYWVMGTTFGTRSLMLYKHQIDFKSNTDLISPHELFDRQELTGSRPLWYKPNEWNGHLVPIEYKSLERTDEERLNFLNTQELIGTNNLSDYVKISNLPQAKIIGLDRNKQALAFKIIPTSVDPSRTVPLNGFGVAAVIRKGPQADNPDDKAKNPMYGAPVIYNFDHLIFEAGHPRESLLYQQVYYLDLTRIVASKNNLRDLMPFESSEFQIELIPFLLDTSKMNLTPPNFNANQYRGDSSKFFLRRSDLAVKLHQSTFQLNNINSQPILDTKLIIFPNPIPAGSEVHANIQMTKRDNDLFRTNTNINLKITILDIEGKPILERFSVSTEINSPFVTPNSDQLLPGTYIIQAIVASPNNLIRRIFTEKLVIIRP